jgi:hypothetical protein
MNFGRMSEVVARIRADSKRSSPVARDEMFNRLEKSLICAPPKHLEEFDHKAPLSCTKYKIPEPSL